MRPIVQRIIDVGSHVNEDSSTEEESKKVYVVCHGEW